MDYNADEVSNGRPLFDDEGNNTGIESGSLVTVAMGYSTTAVKKITEIGNTDNTARSDDEAHNWIALSRKDKTFWYDCLVNTPEDEEFPFSKLVICDALPYVGDHAAFDVRDMRDSKFKVSFLDSDLGFYASTITDKGNGTETKIPPEYLKLYLNEKYEFTDEDWKGAGEGWVEFPGDLSETEQTELLKKARSFRVIIDEPTGTLMPAKTQIRIRVNAKIDDENAKPGDIAWNSFGYSSTVNSGAGMMTLNATPLKVGIKYPETPRLRKSLRDENGQVLKAPSDMDFEFLIYEGDPIVALNDTSEMTTEDIVAAITGSDRRYTYVPLTVKAGEDSAVVKLSEDQKFYSYADGSFTETAEEVYWNGYSKVDGTITVAPNKYTVIELPLDTDEYRFYNFSNAQGTSSVNNFVFTQKSENSVITTAQNRIVPWEIDLVKVDKADSTKKLEGAYFGLYSPNEEDALTDAQIEARSANLDEKPESTITQDEKTWYLAAIGASDAEGILKFNGLHETDYYVKELKAPEHYSLPKGEVHHFNRKEDADPKTAIASREIGNEVLTSYTITKEWLNTDADTVMPESITFQLYRLEGRKEIPEGEPATVTPDEEGNWTYTWQDLKKYNYTADGKETIYYLAKETGVTYAADDKAFTEKITDDQGRVTGFYIYDDKTYPKKQMRPLKAMWKVTEAFSDEDEDQRATFSNALTPATDRYGFQIAKVDKDGNVITAGTAKFKLEKLEDGKAVSEETYETVHGVVTVASLSDATYRLTETEAPAGFVKTDDVFEFSVDRGGAELYDYIRDKNPLVNLWRIVWNWLNSIAGKITGKTENFILGDDQTLKVVNDEIKGKVHLVKTIVDADGEPLASPSSADQDVTATFQIYDSEGNVADTLSIDLSSDVNSDTSVDLKYGTYFIFEDQKASKEGYTWKSVTLNGEPIPKNGMKVQITGVDQVVEVAAVNTYERDLGKLQLVKTFEGDEVNAPKDLKFTVTGPSDFNEGKAMEIPFADFVQEGTGRFTYKLDKIPTGAYTVTESSAEVNGYTVVTEYAVDEEDFAKVQSADADVAKDAETVVTVKNTYTVEETQYDASKIWDDANDQDGKRPTSIVVRLLANGNEITSENPELPAKLKNHVNSDGEQDLQVTLDGSENPEWTYTWTGLPKTDLNGETIIYSAEEVTSLREYETSYEEVFEDNTPKASPNEADGTADAQVPTGIIITNRHTPADAERMLTKTWEGFDELEGAVITAEFTLTGTAADKDQNNEVVTVLTEEASLTASASDASEESEYLFEDLPVYYKGQVIRYSMEETGLTLEMADGAEQEYELGKKTEIANGFTQLVYEKDNIIKRFFEGRTIVGRITSVKNGDYSFTNTFTPATDKYQMAVLKVDENGTPIATASNAEFRLVSEDGSVDLTASTSNALAQFTELPEGEYTLSEVTAPEGFVKSDEPFKFTVNRKTNGQNVLVERLDENDLINFFKLIFRNIAELVTGETGTFGWNEDRQALTVKNERIRGTVSITKKLTASGSDAEIAVSSQNDAEKTAVFEIRNGKGETVDTITIDLTKGETGTSKELEYGSYTIYETTQPDVDRWHFVDVTVDGVSIRSTGKTIRIDENGQVIEVEAQNIYERDLGNLKITKNFKGDMIPGKAPKDLSFTIEGPEDFNDNTGTMTVSYSDFSMESGGNMAYVLEQIPTGMYTVTETGENLNGHTVTVTYTVEGKKTEKTEKTESGELEVMTAGPRNPETDGISTSDINVTNEYVVERTRFGVEKVWEDDDDRDHLRPGSVGVHLLADGADGIEPSTGESVERKEVLSDANSWQMIWDNLPKYDYDGKEIAYSVEEYETEEGSLSFYEAKITEITLTDDAGEAEAKLVTNRHTPSDAEFTVTKEWDDSEDQDGLQPAEVKVTLLADGETFDGRTVDGTGMKENGEPAEVTLNASNDWTYTWKNLPKNKNGYPIAYSVTENEVGYYETIITVNQDGSARTDQNAVFDSTVTNRHTPSNAEYEVEKDWYDNENSNGTRPESINVRLLADGEEIDTVTLSEDNEWAYKWTELPKYKDHGQLIDYSVEEVDTPSAYRPAVVEAETEEVIGEDVTYTAKITNTLRSGNLQITKTGAGDDLKDTDEFTFEITLTAGGDVKDDSFLNETYKAALSAAGQEDRDETVTFTNGTATVTLKYDETLTIMGLPEGVKYSIREIVDENSDRKPDGTVSFETEGTIVGGITQYPLFVNRRNTRTEITVHKTWNDMDDHDKVRPTELEVQLVRHVHFVNDPDKDYEEDWLDPVILNKDNQWTHTWTDLETTEATGSDAQKSAADGASASYADVSSSSKAERASASLASRSDAATESDALFDEDGHLMDGNIFNDLADGFGEVWETIKKTIATIFGIVDEDEVEITWSVKEIGTENLTKYYTAGEPAEKETNVWEIVNTHLASTTRELNGVKFMEGRTLKDGEFTFVLTAVDGAPEAEKMSVTNDASGKFSFGEIKFTTAGTYTYIVTEKSGSASNVAYDGAVFTVKIKVTEDEANGTLTAAEPVYTVDRNGQSEGVEGVSFTNTYTPPDDTPHRGGGHGGGGRGGHTPKTTPPTPEEPIVPETPMAPPVPGALPKTGETGTRIPAVIALLTVMGALFGFARRKDEDDEQ